MKRICMLGFVGFITSQKKQLCSTRGLTPLIDNGGLFLCVDQLSDVNERVHLIHEKDASLLVIGRCSKPATGVSDHYDLGRETASWLLQDYRKNGVGAFSGLSGIYCLLLWDSCRQRLYLVRDDAGAELVYYTGSPSKGFCFSNRLELLLEVSGRPAISRIGLAEYLRFLEVSSPSTMFDGVSQLNSDCVLQLEGSGAHFSAIQIRKELSEVALPGVIAPPPRVFEHLLRAAIRESISNARSVGAFLSGGIDSALICALCASEGIACNTYTVGFADPALDESVIAHRIAGHLGLQHQVLTFSASLQRAAFQEFVASTAHPFADPAIIPTILCYRQVAQEVDAVLDGTGADSLIGSMPARHVRFILDYSRHLPDKIRHVLARLLRGLPRLARYAGLFDYGDERELLIRWRGFTQQELGCLLPWPCDFAESHFFRTFAEHSADRPYELYSHLLRAMGDDRIHQTAARLGLRVEFPYQDAALRQYVRGLPQDWKYTEGETKRLFRRVLEKYVPVHLWNVPKHGFDYPFHELLAFQNGRLVREYLSKDCLDQHGFFDTKVVEDLLRNYSAGDASVNFKIWTLVVFQAWYAHYYQSLGR